MQDADSLVTEILQADLGGISEVTADRDVQVRLTSRDPHGRAIPVASYHTTLDPATSIVAYAMKTAVPVLSPDLPAEKRFTDLFLRDHKVVTALVVPLPVHDRPFGTIGVFSRSPRDYTLDDVRFAETIAHLLSSSIARARAEQQVRVGQVLADAVLESVAEIVFTLDPEGLVTGMNRAACQKTGYAAKEICRRPFGPVFVAPKEMAGFRAALEAAQTGSAQFSGHLMAKDGRRIPIHWLLQPVAMEGRPLCVVLTGRESPETDEPHPFAPADAVPHGNDLRSSPRRNYQYRQPIAPMYTVAIPHKNEFFEVDCKDISAGGISFYLDCPPDFTALVVGLGCAPGLAYFSARLARVVEQRTDGKSYYLVGCRFTGRVHL